jgi:hypothetical protein
MVGRAGYPNYSAEGPGGEILEGNYIGTNAAGSAALVPFVPPNPVPGPSGPSGTVGVWAYFNADISNNLISGQDVGIYDGWGGVTVQGNKIGTDATGTRPIPNGVGIQTAGTIDPDHIGGTTPGAGNTIAYNDGPGIEVDPGAADQIEGNSIYSNAGPGVWVQSGALGHLLELEKLSGAVVAQGDAE